MAERTVPIRSVTLSQRRRSPRSGGKMLTVSAIDSVRKIFEGEGEGAVEVRPRVETRARGRCGLSVGGRRVQLGEVR